MPAVQHTVAAEELQVQLREPELLQERVLRVLRERMLQVNFRIRHRRSRLQGFLYHKWDKT